MTELYKIYFHEGYEIYYFCNINEPLNPLETIVDIVDNYELAERLTKERNETEIMY